MRTIARSAFIAAVIAGAVVLGSSAYAADIARPVYKAPPAPITTYNWTGFYIGGNVGYARGKSNFVSTFDCPIGFACPYAAPVNHAAAGLAGTGSATDNNWTGGGQVGFNWQSGVVVWGVEADFQSFSLGVTRTVSAPFPAVFTSYNITTGYNTDWLFTARGRLGWTVTPTALLYATGGVAVTDPQLTNQFIDNAASFGFASNTFGTSSVSSTRTGWTVGGGLEVALGNNWTAKGEYLYLDFGSAGTTVAWVTNPTFQNPNRLTTVGGDLTAQIVRFGLNYRFNWGKSPVVAKN